MKDINYQFGDSAMKSKERRMSPVFVGIQGNIALL
jgi:hypothetical protein